MSARMSVIVPAHDEAHVLAVNLARMTSGIPRDALQFVVVANGCSDDTAEIARAAGVDVVELATGSKIAALNAGDAAARYAARAYVDADVRVSGETLLALAELLTHSDGPLVASPRFTVDTRFSSLFVRAHYRVWEHTDYRRSGHIGSGVYALSARGRMRFDRFPEVIADDRYVQQLFSPAERALLPGHSFEVPAPRTLRAQIRRATRIQRGNDELAERFPELRSESVVSRAGGLLGRIARRPQLWPAVPVYLVGTVGPRLRAATARGPQAWNRDETSRR
ncbi:glycosyltransferase [Protaetiibacter intestinalis]|uniref:glycosyltransferase n=1 Tax=Protaetiibacter intestinalis TaxID=2419774 RepID=UPI0013003483|nr:glycosyltransferase [Protaetiibacter intestinalis]